MYFSKRLPVTSASVSEIRRSAARQRSPVFVVSAPLHPSDCDDHGPTRTLIKMCISHTQDHLMHDVQSAKDVVPFVPGSFKHVAGDDGDE